MKNFFEKVGLQFFADDGGIEPNGAEHQEPTNQDEGLEDSSLDGFEGGFGDDWGEEPTPEPEQTEPKIQEPQQTTPQEQQFVSIPYNGQTINLPLDALTALNNAFGGNIGQILERGLAPQAPEQPQQPSQEALILDAYAKAAGFPNRQGYMQAMKEQLNNVQVQQEIKNLQMRYPETPPEALLGLAQQTVQVRQREQAQQREFAAQQIQKAQKQAQFQANQRANAEKVKPFLEFYRQYPDVKKDTLSPQFFELVKSGLHPSAAYERLQAEQYKAQLAAFNKNQQNAATSIGSMQGSNVSSDSFLSGFGL